MGRDREDREVYRSYIDYDPTPSRPSGGYSSSPSRSSSSRASSGWRSSAKSEAELENSTGDKKMLPFKRILECEFESPIVVKLDVTGSMGGSAKVVNDKRPLLWGQIEQHGYLRDPGMSIAAVGDANMGDSWPFQVGDFENTPKAIDTWLKRTYIEGGGGGGGYESYADLAWYYAFCVNYKPKKRKKKGYFFIIGDERAYPEVSPEVVKRHFGVDIDEPVPTKKVFEELSKYYHVFYLHVPYSQGGAPDSDKEFIKDWKNYLPETVIKLDEPNAVVDVMLGLIARIEGVRTAETYDADMKDRNQTEERRKLVLKAIEGPSAALATTTALVPTGKAGLPAVVKGKDRSGGKRM